MAKIYFRSEYNEEIVVFIIIVIIINVENTVLNCINNLIKKLVSVSSTLLFQPTMLRSCERGTHRVLF